MKALFILAVLVIGGWHFWGKAAYEQYQAKSSYSSSAKQGQAMPTLSHRFKCDGRTRCSQMTSCEEATFFLQNCPNTKMDGNGDGVPCEKQWCR